MRNLALRTGLCLFVLFAHLSVHAQTVPGTIIRPATSVAGRAVLDPNTIFNFPGNASKSAAGFSGDDVGNSEIAFKPIPALSTEPFADLRRGPDHRFSDFVPDGGDDGVYAYFDNTNLLFRFRMGSIMSGSKGYSILLDTDGRFGPTGAAADPDYQPATTGTNGNPGFEIEIVLETNFKIGIYQVNGSSNPVLIKSYTNWQEYSQISVAGTNDNGDPDFFIDFFIPFSDLQATPFNLSQSTPFRISATTVMAPKAAIGGPKSDIYGVDDDSYKNANEAYEAFIRGQCSFVLTSLQNTSQCPVCTDPPVLNAPLSTGTVTVSGSWTKSTLAASLGTATISVYKNGTTLLGTIPNVASGSNWQLNNVVLNSLDVVTASAQATGESMCLVSNAVTATLCNSATRPAKPVLTCVATGSDFNKGVTGNNLATGWVVYVENLTRATVETSTANAGQFTFSGVSPSMTWNYAGGCSGGPNMASGTYKVYYMNAAGCVSEPVFFCVSGNGGSALAGTSLTPVINVPANGITTAATTISGAGEPNSLVALYVDGAVAQSATANGAGAFAFSNLQLLAGQQVYITNVFTGGTVAASKCLSATTLYSVTCNSQVPLITTDAAGVTEIGAPITGTATPGDLVRVYMGASTLVATTTAGSTGTWSTAAAGTTPSLYTAVSGSYYAVAQTASCGLSNNSALVTALAATSAARCGNITGTVAAGATSISGTLAGSLTGTVVKLYIDGTLIGSATTDNSSWGPIAVNTADKNTALYPNAILTIGVQEAGKSEAFCASSGLTIACTPLPTAPVVSPSNSTTTQNGTVTYTISNAVAGTFYALSEAATGESLGTGVWASANGTLQMTTKQLPTTKTYSVLVKATSINGIDVCTSLPGTATINVSGILPVRSLVLAGKRAGGSVVLEWKTDGEKDVDRWVVERARDGRNFEAIGAVSATAGSYRNTYNYWDKSAPQSAVHYRVRMVDDQTPVYSNTIQVRGVDATAPSAVGPNPFQHNISVSFLSDTDEQVDLLLSTFEGKTIRKVSLRAHKGANTFVFGQLSNLPAGVYMIAIGKGGTLVRHKLIKVE